MSKTSAQQTGQMAEDIAYHYLTQQGLKLRTRNYLCRVGEIDLIMQDKNSLVFVEVRYRRNQNFGTSSETITVFKQKKLLRTANFYLQQTKLFEKIPCRFDVIAISKNLEPANIEWIKNAF